MSLFSKKPKVSYRHLVEEGYDTDGKLIERSMFITDDRTQRDELARDICLLLLDPDGMEVVAEPFNPEKFASHVYDIAEAMRQESRKRCIQTTEEP